MNKMEVARKIFDHVRVVRPNAYKIVLEAIRPHDIDSLVQHFGRHLEACVSDLDKVFNVRYDDDKLARLIIRYAKTARQKFPSPGEAFGIQLTCRVTMSDTQVMLDSKHLKKRRDEMDDEYNVSKNILFDLERFGTNSTILEMTKKKTYYYVILKDQTYDIDSLFKRIGRENKLCVLKRGLPFNRGLDSKGNFVFLEYFQFVYVPEGGRILYRSVGDMNFLLKKFNDDIVAISDVDYVFEKCGIMSFFFNFVRLVRYFKNNNKDVLTILKYMCRSGQPLRLNRGGLAKQPNRTPIEVVGFEAPKTNLSKYCTETNSVTLGRKTEIWSSSDKIFFGQQFNEGTGYNGFALIGK